jgi:hypothetical protein
VNAGDSIASGIRDAVGEEEPTRDGVRVPLHRGCADAATSSTPAERPTAAPVGQERSCEWPQPRTPAETQKQVSIGPDRQSRSSPQARTLRVADGSGPIVAGCGSNGVTWDMSAECHKSPANWHVAIRAGRRFIERNQGQSGGLAASDRGRRLLQAFKERFTSRKWGPDAARTPESSVNPGIQTSLH